MEIQEEIVKYLTEIYQPIAVIVYGSFADGSANETSDFDALVISEHTRTHDSSVVCGVVLDVFVYPAETFQAEFHPEDFLPVSDGKIILDPHGIAAQLKAQVNDYLSELPLKTGDEIRDEIAWCEKMLSRTLREDAEGFFRWHWLLSDSLEIYCDIKHLHYSGPKKALKSMQQTDPEGFCIYSAALKTFHRERLTHWIHYLKTLASALYNPD